MSSSTRLASSFEMLDPLSAPSIASAAAIYRIWGRSVFLRKCDMEQRFHYRLGLSTEGDARPGMLEGSIHKQPRPPTRQSTLRMEGQVGAKDFLKISD